MAKKPRVVLDTNIFVSALVFGGIPEKVLRLVLSKKAVAVISPIILNEIYRVINEKFPLSSSDFLLLEKQIHRQFIIVQPLIQLNVARDKDDDRIIEAAVSGKCQYIITGDKDLLDLVEYKGIKILTASAFLGIF